MLEFLTKKSIRKIQKFLQNLIYTPQAYDNLVKKLFCDKQKLL